MPDPVAEARIRNSLGIVAWAHGDFERALAEYGRALTVLRGLENAPGIGLVLNSIGVTLVKQHRYEEAEHVLREALEVHRTAHDALLEAHAQTALGEIAEMRGDLALARQCYQLSLGLRQSAGDASGTGWMLHRIARVAARAGESDEAGELTEGALRIAAECGDAELRAACDSIFVHE
jgi:tetratricopeptide (TPR) repeat protein